MSDDRVSLHRVVAVAWVVIAISKFPWMVDLLVEDFWGHVVVVYVILTGFGFVIAREWNEA